MPADNCGRIPSDALTFARQWDQAARRVGKEVLCRCPNPRHEDRHRSCNLRLKNDRLMVICRSGCSQREVIDALREQGFWPKRHQPRKPTVPAHIKWEFHTPEVGPCCLERLPGIGRDCEHWAEFRVKYLVAHLRGNIEQAIEELQRKAPAMYGKECLTLDELRSEIIFAGREFGTIWPFEIPEAQAVRILDLILLGRESGPPSIQTSETAPNADWDDAA